MPAAGMISGRGIFFPANRVSGELTLTHVLIFTLVLATLFLLDITTTQVILGMGGVELNPFMAGVVTSPLLHISVKCGILAAVIPVALFAESRVRWSGIALYSILIIMYTLVTLNNISVIIPHFLKGFTG